MKAKKSDEQGRLETMRERFRLAQEYFAEHYQNAQDDVNFRFGDQWPEEIRRIRDIDRRPCLTMSRMSAFVKQVVNDQRRNRPSMQVNPTNDSKSEPETAEVIQSLLHNIEYRSRADEVYDAAFEHAVTTGLGWYRITTEYTSDDSFDLDLRIKSILNQMSVMMDPHSQCPLFSDSNFGFITEEMSKEEFKNKYPDAECYSDGFWGIGEDGYNHWIGEDTVRVVEYFYIEKSPYTLLQLSNGKSMPEDQYKKLLGEASTIVDELSLQAQSEEELAALQQSVPQVVNKRRAYKSVVHWCKTNGYEFLESTIWPGNKIPIIPVIGDTGMKDGKRIFEGIVRQAKDPQRMINFWASAESENIALTPKAPYIGAAGQFENYKKDWKNSNVLNVPYLEYNPLTMDGQLIGPPQRNNFEPNVQAITQARQLAIEDLKAATGIYDPSLGNSKFEESGTAVLARQHQASTTNFHYDDNMTKSLRLAGQMLVQTLPFVLDTVRVVRVVGDEEKVATVGAAVDHDPNNLKYKLGLGQYDVEVVPGKGGTKRQQSIAVMTALSQAAPQVAALCGDIFVKTLDIPEAREMAARIRKTLPANVTGDGPSPEVEQQFAQIKMEGEAMVEAYKDQMHQLQQLNAELVSEVNTTKGKLNNQNAKIASDERTAMLKMKVDLIRESMKADANLSKIVVASELRELEKRADILGLNRPIMDPTEGDSIVVPGINDPATLSGQVPGEPMQPVSPSNLRGQGPVQLGGRVLADQQPQ